MADLGVCVLLFGSASHGLFRCRCCVKELLKPHVNSMLL